MTTEQRQFATALRRLLRKMPKSVELIVRHNNIDICETGARQEYFDVHGDVDNVPILVNVETLNLRVYPGGESL